MSTALPTDPSTSWAPLEPTAELARHPRWHRARLALAAALLVAFILPCMLLVALGVDPDWVMTHPIRWWARAEMWVMGISLDVTGEEHLPAGPFILMANHQSMLDVFTYAGYFRRPVFYVVKKEFGNIPFLGWLMRQTDQVFLDRSDRERAIVGLTKAAEKLRAGKLTVIFPEGTRTAPGTLGPFKKGPFHLALAARVPVLPVTTLNSGLLMPTRTLSFHPGTIRLVISPPIETESWREETLDEHIATVRRAIAGPLGEYRESLGQPGMSGINPEAKPA